MRLLAILILLTTGIFKPAPSELHISLLQRYSDHRLPGIDSTVGEISKSDTGGLKIEYDIGEMAGVETECKGCGWTDGEVWRKKVIVDGEPVTVVYTSKKMLIVSFPKLTANFHGTVNSPEDMADMLLMTMTYKKSFSK